MNYSWGVVQIIVDDCAFPEDAAPFIGGDTVLHPRPIGERADDNDEARYARSQLLLAPMRPALWRPHMIAVELRIDAERPQLGSKAPAPGPNARASRGYS